MRKILILISFFVLNSCEKVLIESNLPAIQSLSSASTGTWKLSQYIDNYIIQREDSSDISGKAQVDLTYYCQRPVQKLASRQVYCEENHIPYLESNQVYTYDNNFQLARIDELKNELLTTTLMLRDEEDKFSGVEYLYPDGSTFKPKIIQNAAGQIIRYINEFIRYDYFWKKDNLIRREVYIKGDTNGGTLSLQNFYVLLPVCLNKTRIDINRYREVKLLQARKILLSVVNQQGWIKAETEVYTYFDHTFPFATTSAGWPSTISSYDLCTPVNDIKSWVTYLVNDKEEPSVVKSFELYFTLISKMGDLPTAESYIQKGSYYAEDEGRSINYTITGKLRYTYQSGCKSPLQTTVY